VGGDPIPVPPRNPHVFRRSKTAEPPDADSTVKVGGKGRPTPTRREAEAAAKARARGPRDRKSASREQRSRRAESNARMREAMRTGDERFLPARDKGPVRRFIRDWVDARLCMAELLLPLLLVIMITSSFAPQVSGGLWTATILLVGLDTVWLVFRLRRELTRRFPGENTRGAIGYAVLRAMQLRFIRLPKPQVKLGAKLRDRY
jgi:hypothetical protein